MTYTEEELDILDRMEDVWSDTLPTYFTFYDWVGVFDGEQKSIATALRAKVKMLKQRTAQIESIYETHRTRINEKYALTRGHGARMKVLEEWAEDRRTSVLKELAITIHQLNFVSGKPPREGEITPQMFERAKQYPITQLIKVGRDRKALCPFHNDRKPSLHVYKDNHAYCFVCPKAADSIEIYRALNHCTFKEAVERLNQL